MSADFCVEEFTQVTRNSLVGFARIRTPSGLIFHDVAVHKTGSNCWAMPGSKPMLGRDGTAIKDASGKVKYTPLVTFASRELRDKFSEAVVAALREAYPRALDDPS